MQNNHYTTHVIVTIFFEFTFQLQLQTSMIVLVASVLTVDHVWMVSTVTHVTARWGTPVITVRLVGHMRHDSFSYLS